MRFVVVAEAADDLAHDPSRGEAFRGGTGTADLSDGPATEAR
jgi:hypothetical protein